MLKKKFEEIKKIIFSKENMEKYSYLIAKDNSEAIYEKLNKNQKMIYTSYKKIEHSFKDLESSKKEWKYLEKLFLKRGIKGWINKLYTYLEKDGCKW